MHMVVIDNETTEITQVSPFSRKANTMKLKVTPDEITKYFNSKELVQNAFPNLTPEEREFILTGITPEELEETFTNAEEAKS